MKQVLAFVILLNCLFASYADIAVEEHDVQLKEHKIISKYQTKISIGSEAISINNEIIQQLHQIIEEAKNAADTTFDINDTVDDILELISNAMLMGEWDPAVLSDQEITFQYKPLLITYSGTLDFNLGQIQGLSTINRSDSATLIWVDSKEVLQISVPVSIREIIATYNFKMVVTGDTIEGVLVAWADDIRATYNADIDLNTMTITKQFTIDIGSLGISLYAASELSSSYSNLIQGLTEDIMNKLVVEYADSIVGDFLDVAFTTVFGVN